MALEFLMLLIAAQTTACAASRLPSEPIHRVPRTLGLHILDSAPAKLPSRADGRVRHQIANPAVSAKTARLATMFRTTYAQIALNDRGFVTSMRARGREFLANGKPSPILSLWANGKTILPVSATYKGRFLTLRFANDDVANVSVDSKGSYLRLQLKSLTPRTAEPGSKETIDDIVWGPLHTTISTTIGDMIGVARDGKWAVGMFSLNDNTTQGPADNGDFGQMYYYIHSPDPQRYPVPKQYREGQRFSIGGDGISDVAFYSHPEEYFHMGLESGCLLEPGSGSALAYHSRDRRKRKTVFYTLIPGLPPTQPRHQEVDPVDADFIGSSVALYACPDDRGLDVLHTIVRNERLPQITFDGVWARDPRSFRPDIIWYGPHDKLIEYAEALGLTSVQDEGLGEHYIDPGNKWDGKEIGFADGRRETIRQFTDELRKHGIMFGLHTLCMFVQPGSSDVHPVPNTHFQTVLRTRLAASVSPESTDISVTEPSFLAEKGTWHDNQTNVLRIGSELLTYDGMSDSAPWTLKNVKRGQYGTQASAHRAGDELVKLQITCYHGFIPDMTLLKEYADLYAKRLTDLGTQFVDFDGLESCMYQNQGDYAFKTFFRELCDRYSRLNHGHFPRFMGSCVTEGNWLYMSICDIGGGNNMFDPVNNRWGIEGKDERYQFASNYFPASLGGQDLRRDWTEFDAENLEAKSIGWDATFMLGLSQQAVESTGEKSAIFRSFRTWEDARRAGVFSPTVKAELRDMDRKFHLVRAGQGFDLYPVKEDRREIPAGGAQLELSNPYAAQPLQFALQLKDGAANGVEITLPDGSVLSVPKTIEGNEYVVLKPDRAYVADAFRRPIFDLTMPARARLPHGGGTITIRPLGVPDSKSGFELRVWALGNPTRLQRH